nr:reticulon-like protein B17 [Tanacetum cinerariifolium]
TNLCEFSLTSKTPHEVGDICSRLKAIRGTHYERAITAEVAPLFLLGSEYDDIVRSKRLCALGFFICFVGPKVDAKNTDVKSMGRLFSQENFCRISDQGLLDSNFDQDLHSYWYFLLV